MTVMADQWSRNSVRRRRRTFGGKSGKSSGVKILTSKIPASANGSMGESGESFSCCRARTEVCSAQVLKPRGNICPSLSRAPYQLLLRNHDKCSEIVRGAGRQCFVRPKMDSSHGQRFFRIVHRR